MARVVNMTLTVQVSTNVSLPSWIKLDPDAEGSDWYVRYTTLHYLEDDEWKTYDLGIHEYDGEYKRPTVEVTKTERVLDDEDEDAAAAEIAAEVDRLLNAARAARVK